MVDRVPKLTLAPRRLLTAGVMALLLCLGWCAPGAQAASADPEADFAPLTLAVADFATVQAEASLGPAAARTLREALAGHPLLDLKQGDRVQRVMHNAAPLLLSARSGVAPGIATELGARALVYGLLWEDPSAELWFQLWVVDCRPRTARVYCAPPMPWPTEPAAQREALLSALQTVLPPVARVLALIRTGGQTEVQLFPFAGVPLRTNTAYLIFEPRERDGGPDYLPLLLPGAYHGRVQTLAGRDNHVLRADPADEARVQVGDLVYVPLTESVRELPAPGQMLVTDPPHAPITIGERLVGYSPLMVPGDSLPTQARLTPRDYESQQIALSPPRLGWEGQVVALAELPPFGSLRLTSDPPGATVTLAGETLGATPLERDQLPAGLHRLTVDLPGYEPVEQEVDIPRAAQTDLHLTLVRQIRELRLSTTPPGAEVTWEGDSLGPTPLTLPEVPVGRYAVQLTLPAYLPVDLEAEVAAGAGPQELSFDLTRLVGTLRVQTTPPGARIEVAGRPHGEAPLTIEDLDPGEYVVTARLEGYREATDTVTIRALEGATLALTLQPRVGALELRTIPAGARITLGGEARGRTPATLEDVPEGEHPLRLEVDNLRAWEGRVTVRDGETTSVEVGLLPLQMESRLNPDVVVAQTPSEPAPAALPPIQEYEGSEELPVLLPILELARGEQRFWTTPLTRLGEQNGTPVRVQLVFELADADTVHVALNCTEPFPAQVSFQAEGDRLVATVPGLRAGHNPEGVRLSAGGVRQATLTNTGPDGSLQVILDLASGAQVGSGPGPASGRSVQATVIRPRPRGTEKWVALTLDDTPFPAYTERLLALLSEHQVPATLFVVGQKAAQMPELVRRAYELGHSIQNHSQTHPRFRQIPPAEVRRELEQCTAVIRQITGRTPTFYRPPGGGVNRQVEQIAEELGLQFAGWDVNVHDYDTPQAQVIAERVISRTRGGDIILLHDGVEATLQALPEIIRTLRDRGFVFVTMDELAAR